MSVIQQFEKELISLAFALLTAIVFYLFRARARLVWASPHSWTFLIHRVIGPNDQKEPRPTLLVHTASVFVANLGRVSASEIEVTFNFPPENFNIWPARPYKIENIPDGRMTLQFANLAPKEQFQIELLSVNNLPPVLAVRCKECIAKQILMRPSQVFSSWVTFVVRFLMILGVAAFAYILLIAIAAIRSL